MIIRLDASGWSSPDHFYAALLPELGAPEWHGANLDALHDSLCGGINAVEAPLTVEIVDTGALGEDMTLFLARVAAAFRDARRDGGGDVRLVLR